jgi:hypothetical protein
MLTAISLQIESYLRGVTTLEFLAVLFVNLEKVIDRKVKKYCCVYLMSYPGKMFRTIFWLN